MRRDNLLHGGDGGVRWIHKSQRRLPSTLPATAVLQEETDKCALLEFLGDPAVPIERLNQSDKNVWYIVTTLGYVYAKLEETYRIFFVRKGKLYF